MAVPRSHCSLMPSGAPLTNKLAQRDGPPSSAARKAVAIALKINHKTSRSFITSSLDMKMDPWPSRAQRVASCRGQGPAAPALLCSRTQCPTVPMEPGPCARVAGCILRITDVKTGQEPEKVAPGKPREDVCDHGFAFHQEKPCSPSVTVVKLRGCLSLC